MYMFLQAENMRQLQLRNGHVSAFGRGHREFVLQNAHPRIAAIHAAEAPANPDENPTGLKYRGIILHGVASAMLKDYRPDEELNWKCLGNPEVVIHWSKVNNNECDCPDGSDEPGTSACVNFHFFCETEKRFISSSKVNDGICDCCDGADEWKGVELTKTDHPFPDTAKLAPCKNFCHEIKLEQEMKMDTMNQGLELRTSYLSYFDKNPNVINTNDVYDVSIFGEGHVYLKLSQRCFHYRSPSYLYELCPFRVSKQTDGDKKSHSLGKAYPGATDLITVKLNPSQLKLEWDDSTTLSMAGGDMCPGDNPRTTKIKFQCGTVDQILYVDEVQTCTYQFDFSTPAACNDSGVKLLN